MAQASYRFLKWGAAMKVRQLDMELCNLGAVILPLLAFIR